MALTFSRQYAEGSMGTGVAFGGVVPDSDVIRYLVPGVTKADALANLDLVAITTHPDGLPLTVQAKNPTERVGAGADVGWYVDVVFGKNRLSGSDVRITPPDTTNIDYVLDSASFRKDIITIPVVVETELVFPQPITGIPISTFLSRTIEVQRVLPRTVYNLRLNVNSFTQSDLYAIEDQTGKIHQFGGRKWLFEGGDSSESEQGVFTINYSWLGDPGTPELEIPTGDGVNQAITTPERPPFHDYVIRFYVLTTGPLSGQSRARVETVQTYEEDLTGYLSLPGGPHT